MTMAPSAQQQPILSGWTLFLLAMVMFLSWRFLTPSYNSLKDDGTAGRVTRAQRLPSWLRERAIEKLPKHLNPYGRGIGGDPGEVQDALGVVHKWASRSTKNNTVDVVIIGSLDRMEYIHAQQMTWASMRKHPVRNIYPATERNSGNAMMSDGSCQKLIEACVIQGSSRQLENSLEYKNEQQLCLERRLGLGMGASVIRYRKIIHALNLKRQGNDTDESTVDLKQYNMSFILPNFLIVTFDSAYYDTERLEECAGIREEDVPVVYAPFISWTDVGLGVKQQLGGDGQQSKFPYPTNNAGVVFNRPALELWVKRFSCIPPTNYYSSSAPIQVDPIEHDFCMLMSAVATNDFQHNNDTFVSAIRGAFEIDTSLAAQKKKIDTTPHGFVYSTRYHAVSLSDIFFIYSSMMHLLCKQMGRIPSGEEMLGYLISRVQVSRGGLSEGAPNAKSSCKANAAKDCSPEMVACANLTLQGLKDKI